MSNEITYQFQLLLNNGKLKDQYSSSSSAANQTTAALMRNVQTISNSAPAQALDLGSVTTPGFAVFQNLDSTNFVDFGAYVGGTFYPFLRLKAGESGMLRLSTNPPYALADTAAVSVFYVIYAD
jgi:hypothetical protein